MGLTRTEDMGAYARLLRRIPAEVASLADDLLIHVTGFFRDPEAWEALREHVVVPLIDAREQDASIRCWVTACSSGEEAYSLAMLLVEEAERTSKHLDIKVFATDTAELHALARHAQRASTPAASRRRCRPSGSIGSSRRRTPSTARPHGPPRAGRLRACVAERPARPAVLAGSTSSTCPASPADLPQSRPCSSGSWRRLAPLRPAGEGETLFLGTSETVAGSDDLFETIDKKARIYRRLGPTRHGVVDFPLPHALEADGRASPRRRDSEVRRSGGNRSQRPSARPHSRPRRRSALPRFDRSQLTAPRLAFDHHIRPARRDDR